MEIVRRGSSRTPAPGLVRVVLHMKGAPPQRVRLELPLRDAISLSQALARTPGVVRSWQATDLKCVVPDLTQVLMVEWAAE